MRCVSLFYLSYLKLLVSKPPMRCVSRAISLLFTPSFSKPPMRCVRVLIASTNSSIVSKPPMRCVRRAYTAKSYILQCFFLKIKAKPFFTVPKITLSIMSHLELNRRVHKTSITPFNIKLFILS